jgi:Family of unknown function (DUF6074)
MRRQRESLREPTRATLRGVADPPSATILAFPIAARRDLVGRIVEQMLDRDAETAEQHLRQHLACQERTLFKKQIPPEAIVRELKSLEAAVRAGLWRYVLGGGRP